MISVSNLSVTTKRGSKLLSQVSANFAPGNIHVIVGLNGSGKTTLLRSICQLQQHSEGEILIDGVAADSLTHIQRAHKISWTESEHPTTFAYSVRDIILWGRWPHHQGYPTVRDINAANHAAEMMGISDKLSLPVTTLSLGERKKVHLAKALASDAKYLIWDEPCGPLDIRSALDLFELSRAFAAEGRAIIMSLHDIGMALRYADSIVILNKGEVAWSGPAKDVSCIRSLNATFKVSFDSNLTLKI